jgi:hypothetical protein
MAPYGACLQEQSDDNFNSRLAPGCVRILREITHELEECRRLSDEEAIGR